MRTRFTVFMGVLLCLVSLLTLAYIFERGGVNAVSMYAFVFGFYAFGLGAINGFLLKYVERNAKKKISLAFCGVTPFLLLILYIMSNDLQIMFVGEFGAIGIGITNLIWITVKMINQNKEFSN